MYRPLSATRTRSCEIRPCLRIFSASNAATRSAPVLAWRDGGNLCVCRAGRCGHRPLRLFIGNRCVGVGLPDDPPGFVPRSLQKTMSLRSQCAHWLWQSASPVPMAPLPKGGWHGEAVTGGFFFAPHRADKVVRPYTRLRRGDPCGRPPHDHCTPM